QSRDYRYGDAPHFIRRGCLPLSESTSLEQTGSALLAWIRAKTEWTGPERAAIIPSHNPILYLKYTQLQRGRTGLYLPRISHCTIVLVTNSGASRWTKGPAWGTVTRVRSFSIHFQVSLRAPGRR